MWGCRRGKVLTHAAALPKGTPELISSHLCADLCNFVSNLRPVEEGAFLEALKEVALRRMKLRVCHRENESAVWLILRDAELFSQKENFFRSPPFLWQIVLLRISLGYILVLLRPTQMVRKQLRGVSQRPEVMRSVSKPSSQASLGNARFQ